MRIVEYPKLIKENLSELKRAEKRQKNARLRLRVQMLRLLKSGQVAQVKQASQLLGISSKHAYTLWHRYQQQGLEKYLSLDYTARAAKLTAAAQRKVVKKAKTGYVSQRAAQAYIKAEFGVSYTQQGISMLFQRLKIKAKIPRPANIMANKEEQQAYKKSLRRG